jgi:membrane associated rhomboid family serine protease
MTDALGVVLAGLGGVLFGYLLASLVMYWRAKQAMRRVLLVIRALAPMSPIDDLVGERTAPDRELEDWR